MAFHSSIFLSIILLFCITITSSSLEEPEIDNIPELLTIDAAQNEVITTLVEVNKGQDTLLLELRNQLIILQKDYNIFKEKTKSDRTKINYIIIFNIIIVIFIIIQILRDIKIIRNYSKIFKRLIKENKRK